MVAGNPYADNYDPPDAFRDHATHQLAKLTKLDGGYHSLVFEFSFSVCKAVSSSYNGKDTTKLFCIDCMVELSYTLIFIGGVVGRGMGGGARGMTQSMSLY